MNQFLFMKKCYPSFPIVDFLIVSVLLLVTPLLSRIGVVAFNSNNIHHYENRFINTNTNVNKYGYSCRQQQKQQQSILPTTTTLCASEGGNNNNKKRELSASERGRREEEKQRLLRKNDVVIGKTSAKRDAVDYQLNVKATEEQWLQQASNLEQKVFKLTEYGLQSLKSFQLEASEKAFDEVYELKPNAYLWQAGITKYYLGKYKEAATIFYNCALLYENKLGMPASEERIWRDACELKLLYSKSNKERKLLIQDQLQELNKSNNENRKITTTSHYKKREEFLSLLSLPKPLTKEIPALKPVTDSEGLMPMIETRKVIRIARDLFSATVHNDYGNMILSRAKLRSIGGTFEDCYGINSSNNKNTMEESDSSDSFSSKPATTFFSKTRRKRKFTPDQKMWKLTSWYYLGLHFDSFGLTEESKACMKMALMVSPGSNGKSDDIIHSLPLLHMTYRDWFDDDDMDNDPLEILQLQQATTTDDDGDTSSDGNNNEDASIFSKHTKNPNVDSIFISSVQNSLTNMRLVELRDAARQRGLGTSGSKNELQSRLFNALMDDDSIASTLW